MHEGASPGALPVEGGASPGAIPGEGGAIPGAEPLVVAPGAEAPAASSKSMPTMPRQPAPTTAKRVRDALSKGGLRNLESTSVFHHDCMIMALDCLNSAFTPGTIVAFGAETMPLGRFERYVVPKIQDILCTCIISLSEMHLLSFAIC